MNDLLVPWVAIASDAVDDRSRRAIAGRVPIICSPITSNLRNGTSTFRTSKACSVTSGACSAGES